MHHPRIIADGEELRRQVRAWQAAGETVGLVPTMGALHAGHLSLAARSVRECRRTVVTIFVNPKQFGPAEDFQRYPRDLIRDVELLAGLAASQQAREPDLVFAPAAEAIYPADFATHVEVGRVTQLWEGASRAGHFRGVATVVLKLFQLAPADIAYFGQKDYQQTVVIRRMVADLNLPIEIRVSPIVREPDGLAMSSRNAFLGPDDRRRALALSASLRQAVEMVRGGQRDARRISAAMRQTIGAVESVTLDYAAVVDPETLEELDRLDGRAVALVAAKVGAVRLIDNEILNPPAGV